MDRAGGRSEFRAAGPAVTRVPTGLAAVIGAAFGFASTRLGAGDSDVFWHLVAGRETLAHGLARADMYSWYWL